MKRVYTGLQPTASIAPRGCRSSSSVSELSRAFPKFMVDCSTDPARHRPVVLPRAPADLVERLGPSSSSSVLPISPGETVGSDIAADRPTPCCIPRIQRCEQDDQDPAAHLAHHEPVRGRLGRVEEGIRAPHVVDAVDPEPGMLEQMGGLVIDLDGSSSSSKSMSSRFATRSQCNTTGYIAGADDR